MAEIQSSQADKEIITNKLLVALKAGDYAKAETAARQLTSKFPLNGSGWKVLGAILASKGEHIEAIVATQRAVELMPKDSEIHNILGVLLKKAGEHIKAEKCFREAIRLQPDYAEAHNNLGNTLNKQGKYLAAEGFYRSANQLTPSDIGVFINLGNTLKDLCKNREAEECYRTAIRLKFDCDEAQSKLLFNMNFSERDDDTKHLIEASNYWLMLRRKVKNTFDSWGCEHNPQRIKVGVVSGDLYEHPVGFFLEGVLQNITEYNIDLIAYPTSAKHDDLTKRIKPFFVAWKPLDNLRNDSASRLIHSDGVHILLDLSGHTNKNRLPIFCEKPAPIQASWLGYSNTTGIKEIDYIIADKHVIPFGDDDKYVEKVYRLPDSYICFTPPTIKIEIKRLPALDAGHVTFGCLNNFSKVNKTVLKTWANILGSVKNSRLLLKSKHFNDNEFTNYVIKLFGEYDIHNERLLLFGSSRSREDVLKTYDLIDIALDPFPYNGTTTTTEALWMGVPSVTLQGSRFISRVGLSIANNIGLGDWVAENSDEYIQLAIRHSSDLKALNLLRGLLREKLLSSNLCDVTRFSENMASALWCMWHEHVRVDCCKRGHLNNH